MRVFDEAVKLEGILRGVDVRNASLIAYEVKRVWCDWLRGYEALRRLSVIWKLEEMQHIWVLFLNHSLKPTRQDNCRFHIEKATYCPALLGNARQRPTDTDYNQLNSGLRQGSSAYALCHIFHLTPSRTGLVSGIGSSLELISISPSLSLDVLHKGY